MFNGTHEIAVCFFLIDANMQYNNDSNLHHCRTFINTIKSSFLTCSTAIITVPVDDSSIIFS